MIILIFCIKHDILYKNMGEISIDIKEKNIFKRIIEENWDNFKEVHPEYERKQYNTVINKMLKCGDEFGGHSEYVCSCCGEDTRSVPFSCKSMFCLSCTKVYVDELVTQISKMLHPGMRYRHVVLTVPEQLRIYFYEDRLKGELIAQLIKEGHKCLEEALSEVFRRKVKIGTIIVLQTHGRSGHYNPHIHIIMTNGGIDIEKQEWKELGFIPFEKLHTKWQYYLTNMMKKEFKTKEMKDLVNELYRKYPEGFVANISKGRAPKKAKGLAMYLAKYVASPPISVNRIIKYDGESVTYWYNDHETKRPKKETVDVLTFVGRMVQHILPKGFQRVRYYGLQSVKTYKKWKEIIVEGIKGFIGNVKDVYEVVKSVGYRERFKKGSGKDPFKCRYCGGEMILWKIWHPRYGVIYEKSKEPREKEIDRGSRHTIWTTTENVQLSMF